MPDVADWKIMEKAIARKLKGQLTPGSGNQSIKGDVHTDLFIIEAKWRRSQSGKGFFLTLQESWLVTIIEQAAPRHKEPLLAICVANYVTYYLIPYAFWEQTTGRMEDTPVTDIDCTDRTQVRIYANEDHSYHRFLFSAAGVWIALPENDLMLLVELERQRGEDAKQCTTQPTKPRRIKPEKTAQQIEWEQEAKLKKKAWRKQASQDARKRRKETRTTGQ